jgi:hypothetical protein
MSKMSKPHKITVSAANGHKILGGMATVPQVLIKGKYLNTLGFKYGDILTLILQQNGDLLLSKQKKPSD